MEDTHMEDDAPATTITASDVGTAYIPPSVDIPAVLAGDTFTYMSPIPAILLPSPPPPTSSTSSTSTSTSPTRPGLPCALGVDEAGRGPVLGPMVYGVFFLPLAESDGGLLRDPAHRFDDSKVLTPQFRDALMRLACTPGTRLADTCGFAVTALSARDIAAGMLRGGGGGGGGGDGGEGQAGATAGPYNLNAQAFDATVGLIRAVMAAGVDVREVYVDTVGPPATYQKRLERVFPTARITVAKKADSLYPCVSAASVCAKVTRDAALEVLARRRREVSRAGKGAVGEETDGLDGGEEGAGWGSGYPSDARCVAWMRRNMHPVFGWGDECRFSWGTAKDMLEAKGKGVKVDWPVDEDEDNSRLTEYFSAAAAKDKEGDELANWYGTPLGLEAF